jgi:hypothetical protein
VNGLHHRRKRCFFFDLCAEAPDVHVDAVDARFPRAERFADEAAFESGWLTVHHGSVSAAGRRL